MCAQSRRRTSGVAAVSATQRHPWLRLGLTSHCSRLVRSSGRLPEALHHGLQLLARVHRDRRTETDGRAAATVPDAVPALVRHMVWIHLRRILYLACRFGIETRARHDDRVDPLCDLLVAEQIAE